MADYKIEIGATDGFRYIGVQPPLDDEQRQEALSAIGEDIEFQGSINGKCFSTVDGRRPYSELAIATTIHRERVPVVAGQVAGVLIRQGHGVNLDLQARYVDADGHYQLFGDKSKAIPANRYD